MRYPTLILAALLSKACIPLDDCEECDELCVEVPDFGEMHEIGLDSDAILLTCAYFAGELYGMQVACLEDFEDPAWLDNWKESETPEACAHYGAFCWKCGQIYGQEPAGDEFYTFDVLGCIDDLTYDMSTCGDVAYVESAQSGPCWMITTGGQL